MRRIRADELTLSLVGGYNDTDSLFHHDQIVNCYTHHHF